MLSKNTVFSYIFLFSLFPGLIISCEYVKFADEIVCALLCGLVALDCYANGWKGVKRYKPLWLLVLFISFYAVYSVLFCHYNTPKYIISDLISQIKPFMPFLIVKQMGVRLRPDLKYIAKYLCIVNTFLMIVFYVWGRGELILPFGHIAYLGGICMVSGLLYVFCSLDSDGKISQKDLLTAFSILAVGLICGRSKYFGQFVVCIALFLWYRQGLLSHITFKHVISVFAILSLVILVAWNKIQYYFVQGAMDMLENDSLEAFSDSFARPMLYVTGGQILLDHFPFGSGLASFASNASAVSYSTLYYDYGLDKVWGLSPAKTDFICDAYYPTLCQFGIVGVIWFVLFWRWILKLLAEQEKLQGLRFHYPYIIGLSLIVFILIESIGGTSFIQAAGLQSMMILGLLLTDNTEKQITENAENK